jgi:hypothetical protein
MFFNFYANLTSSFLIFGTYTIYNDYNYYNKLKVRSNKELNEIYNKIIPNVILNVHILSIPAIYCFYTFGDLKRRFFYNNLYINYYKNYLILL